MNKKIFSFGLYKDGLKQIKLVGILFTVLFSLGAVIPPIYSAASLANTPDFDLSTYTPRIVNGVNTMGFLIMAFILVSPLLTFSMFKFLNKRNSSDFYHSLPYTRTCIYLSFFASVVTWLAVAVAVPTIVGIITYSVLGKFFTIVPLTFIKIAVNCFVGGVLVAAAATIGASLSGTIFTNAILTLLVIFVPRFIITLFTAALTQVNPLLISDKIMPLISNNLNVPVGVVMNGFLSEMLYISFDLGEILTSTSSCIYTLVVALIMVALGIIAFNTRKSETATLSAPSKFLQNVYRIIIGTVYGAAITTILFVDIHSGYEVDKFAYIIVYAVGVIIYYLYEILTTKKLKNLIGATPGLLVVAILNVAMFGGMNLIDSMTLKFNPDVSEINSVSIMSTSGNNDYYSDSQMFTDLLGKKSEAVEIKDAKVNEIISKSLKKCIDTYKNYPDVYYSKFSTSYTDEETNTMVEEYQLFNVKINSKEGTKYRSIYLNRKDSAEITSLLSKNEEYRKIWSVFPDSVNGAVELPNSIVEFTTDEKKDIYNTLKSEYDKLGFEKVYEYFNGDQSIQSDEKQYILSIYADEKGKETVIWVKGSVFPETCKKIYEYEKAHTKEMVDEELKGIKECLADPDYEMSGNMEIYLMTEVNETEEMTDETYKTNTTNEYCYNFSNKTEYKPEALEWVTKTGKCEAVDYDKSYVYVYYEFNPVASGKKARYFSFYLVLDGISEDDIPSMFSGNEVYGG